MSHLGIIRLNPQIGTPLTVRRVRRRRVIRLNEFRGNRRRVSTSRRRRGRRRISRRPRQDRRNRGLVSTFLFGIPVEQGGPTQLTFPALGAAGAVGAGARIPQFLQTFGRAAGRTARFVGRGAARFAGFAPLRPIRAGASVIAGSALVASPILRGQVARAPRELIRFGGAIGRRVEEGGGGGGIFGGLGSLSPFGLLAGAGLGLLGGELFRRFGPSFRQRGGRARDTIREIITGGPEGLVSQPIAGTGAGTAIEQQDILGETPVPVEEAPKIAPVAIPDIIVSPQIAAPKVNVMIRTSKNEVVHHIIQQQIINS